MEYSIETHDLVKRFNGLTAVNKVNLKVKKGELFGFLGPNGAGKTTTINMLITLLEPTSGRATVNGHDVVKESVEVRHSIGIVPQESVLEGYLSAYENLIFYGKLYHVPMSDLRERIPELLAMVQLDDRAHDLVRTFSGGMKRRLEIAKAFLHEPEIIFMDEPTLGLDIQTRLVIWEHIRELNREKNITIFLTTHYMEEADALCGRIAIIDNGVIQALGTSDELKKSIGKGEIIDLKVAGSAEQLYARLTRLNLHPVKRDGGLRIVLPDAGPAVQKIMLEAQKLRTPVTEISMHESTLDDVFIHYTGKGIREQRVEPTGGAFSGQMMRRMMGR